MKGNDGTGNVEKRDNWQTPQWLFDKLNKQYKFEFDCCASQHNKKCESFTSHFEEIECHGNVDVCWMNPPFTKAKMMFEHFFKVVNKGVAIYKCDNIETKLWIDIMKKADWIFVFDGRIHYEGKSGKGARFGSALIGVGLDYPKLECGQLLICSSNLNKENKRCQD